MKSRVAAKMQNHDKIIGQQNLTKKKKRKNKKNRKINRTLKNKNKNKNRKINRTLKNKNRNKNRKINRTLKNKNRNKNRKNNNTFNQTGGHFNTAEELENYLNSENLNQEYITQLVTIFKKRMLTNKGGHEQFNNKNEAFGEINQILSKYDNKTSIEQILIERDSDYGFVNPSDNAQTLSAAIDFFLFGIKRDFSNTEKYNMLREFVSQNPEMAESMIKCEDIKDLKTIETLKQYIIDLNKWAPNNKINNKHTNMINDALGGIIYGLMEFINIDKDKNITVKNKFKEEKTKYRELEYKNNKIYLLIYNNSIFVPIECIIKYLLFEDDDK
jgi:hypothetical protein